MLTVHRTNDMDLFYDAQKRLVRQQIPDLGIPIQGRRKHSALPKKHHSCHCKSAVKGRVV